VLFSTTWGGRGKRRDRGRTANYGKGGERIVGGRKYFDGGSGSRRTDIHRGAKGNEKEGRKK